ncbi:restriction endonuclease subunit S [Pseudomonas putida]|uniref:restriction endonuclease subunit S n=1 Tax=Pseudomonas putida TaxID=303 RepID=UPI0021185553|nr:restriction endonuclease subunit S [Pseudomonas putida]
MKHWGSAKLHELVTFVIGGDWGKDPSADDDGYVDVFCIRGTELREWQTDRGKTAAHRKIKRSSLAKRQLQEGDLILEISGGGPDQPVGRVERIDCQTLAQNPEFPKICTNFFRRLEITKEVDSSYLAWYLKFFYRTGEVVNYQAGSNNLRNLQYPEYEKLTVPLPPLGEQRRIVEKIEALFAQLDQGETSLRDAQKLLERYSQSLLKAAVTGQLTSEWRAENTHRLGNSCELLQRILQARRHSWHGRSKYQDPDTLDITGLSGLPEGWVWVTVDQILRASLSNGRSVPDAQVGFPVLRLTALKDGVIDISERKIGAWNAESAAPFLAQKGDVLVSRGNGSKQLVGRGGLVKVDPDPVAYPDTMIRIPILLDFVSPEWFLQLWNSPFMRGQIEKSAKTTAGIYKINQADIRSFCLPLPPLIEQIEIVESINEAFDKIRTAKSWCVTELSRSAALRQSILKDAFSGKLVPQEPSDEPVAELLARIHAERVSAPAKSCRASTKEQGGFHA